MSLRVVQTKHEDGGVDFFLAEYSHGFGTWLDPDEARKSANKLLKAADKAEQYREKHPDEFAPLV